MKNLSVVLNCTVGGSFQQTPHDYSHRQSRTYGPLVSFLLATFLTKAVAKYAASSLLPISHRPWLSNKPVNYLSFNQIQQPNQIWRPASPYLHGLTAFAAEGYHDHYSPPDPLQTEDHHTTDDTILAYETPSTIIVQNSPSNKEHTVDTTIESPNTFDQFTSQSQYNYRRQLPPQRWNLYPRREYPPPRRDYANRFPIDPRNRYPTNHYRTTTPYYDYYDQYDDLATRPPPYRTRRPPIRRRPTTENYEDLYDNSEYDDSLYDDYYEKTTKFYERTTKPYRKRRKPTKRTKAKKRNDDSDEYKDSDESIEQLDDKDSKETEKPKESEFKPKPRQAATTTTTTEPSTTTETTESTTTESTTTSATTKPTPSTTTQGSQNATQPTGYGPGGNYDHISLTYGPPVVHKDYGPPYNIHHSGYGPSHGNEAISITQNPSPFPLFYHNFPYTNLFPQDLTKNAIVQKVHDIVGFEHDFVHRE